MTDWDRREKKKKNWNLRRDDVILLEEEERVIKYKGGRWLLRVCGCVCVVFLLSHADCADATGR